MRIFLSKLTLTIAAVLFSAFFALAQDMEVTDGATAPYTPENLITNVFLGEGVEVTSFQYDGAPEAVGFFNNAQDELGIERGIIMSTGRAATMGTNYGAEGIGSNFASFAHVPNITADADLMQLDPANANNNISRYTISFIPTSDTVRFNYIFASEEYPEYACSSFNDVFGFFISGPGINGPFSNNAENIALVPGTTDFVSINNVHPQNGPGCNPVNEEFYNDNNSTSNQPVYDGFTDIFTAERLVIPCQEYTLKIVIADKGDEAFDSGVFLEAKSFSSPPLDIDIATVSLDGSIVEGCTEAEVELSLPNPVEADTPLDYEILGQAENGVDYPFIPLDLFIPQGESSVSFTISGIDDGIDEAPETWGIAIQVDPCNRDTFWLLIRDNDLYAPDLGPDIAQCASESTTLMGNIDIPVPPVPTFTNETDMAIDPVGTAICSPVTVLGVLPPVLEAGVIREVCINIDHNWDDDLDIFLQTPNEQFLELSTDNGANGNDYIQTCFTEDAITPINFPGPFAPASATPFTGEWQPEGVWSDIYGAPTNGEWKLLVIDDANGFAGTLLDWSISFEPVYQIFYEWTPSEGLSCDDCPNPEASPNVSTTYTLRAYDSYGCEVYDEIFVEVFPAFPAPEVVCSDVQLDCLTFSWDDVGAPDYEVNVDGTGWVPANGSFSHEVCGLGATQTVMIEVRVVSDTDCNGFIGVGECTTPDCQVPTVLSQTTTDVSCFNGADGTLQIEMTGNFPPFTYEIDGQTQANVVTANFTGLSAALHDLMITDASGCELTLQVLIEEPAPIEFNDVVIQNVQCYGANDGSATVEVTSGQGPFGFNWSNGETDSIAVALGSGNAMVTVTDANGCTLVGTIPITEPDLFEVTLNVTDNNLCFGGEVGAIESSVTGGFGAYTYAWDSGQDTPNISNLAAGDYMLVVTDENQCTATQTVTITENSEITTSTNNTQATCSGTGDGTATVTAQGGGVGVYTYQWDANAANQVSQTATGLDVGWYYVTVTDLFNCAVVDSVEITAPNAVSADIEVFATDCFNTADGDATLTVTGGTEPYSYAWSDGGNPDPTRDDLAAGMQTVTVTDANDCFTEVEFTISAPDEITLNVSDITAATCFGLADGALTCQAVGGVGQISFLWNDAAAQTTATATNLAAGEYCVTATDENGCEATICETVGQPDAISELTENIVNVSCFEGADGAITVNVEGGTAPYDYLWNDAAAQTTQTATGLNVGTYQVVVEDANDCSIVLEYTVAEPTELTASTAFTALSCDGTPDGTATVTGTGGTEPYTYAWQGGQDTQTAVNLEATTYTVTVTDANGCQAEAAVTLTAPVEVVIDNVPSTDVSCFGGSDGEAALVYSGGTAPFTITWSNGDVGENVLGLSANTYSVTITDQSGCTATETITINQPEDLNITLAQSSALCNNGNDGTASVTALAYGNTPADLANFLYSWDSSPSQNTAQATGLTGGQTYTVLITDAAGCQWTESIEVDNPAPVEASIIDSRNISCFEGTDGTAQVAGAGGTLPYSYQWSANANNQVTEVALDLAAGTYTVTVTDASGCSTETEVTLTEPEELDLSFGTKEPSCPGLLDGSISVDGTGGTTPYTYAWSSGGNQMTEVVGAGLYYLTLTDNNNCTLIDSVRVTEPEPVVTELIELVDASCFDYQDGAIDLSSTGGTPPYRYSVDGVNFTGSSRLIALAAGNYDVTIRDGNGCEYYLNDLEINEPEELTVDLGPDVQIQYGEEVEFMPNVEPLEDGMSYDWTVIGPGTLDCYDCAFPTLIDTFSGQAAFEVVVTNANGCTADDLLTVFVNKNVFVVVPSGFSPNGDANNDLLHVHGDSDITVSKFTIYDRWGEPVYEAQDFMINDTSVGWDGNFRGQEMPPGVYVWYIEVEAEDGEPAVFKGSTTLLR